MQTSQKPSCKASPTKRQLIIIFFLATTLFIGIIIKTGMDYHWWLPETEIESYLKPEDLKVKLDINSAPWHELVLLPKLGEAKARAIVVYRKEHGDFQSLDELGRVKGIGTTIIDAIKEHITIRTPTADSDISEGK